MEFDKPSEEKDMYSCKFLRVEKRFFVTEPDDLFTQHKDLAEADGISGEIMNLRRENPIAIDGGFLYINNGKKEVIIFQDSYGLRLPIKPVARQTSRELLQEKLPDHQVTEQQYL